MPARAPVQNPPSPDQPATTGVVKLRPSDAHRWLVCRAAPGFVAANEHRIPKVEYDYTKEGEEAHALAKVLLTTNVVPADTDPELLDPVRGYVNFVRAQMEKHPGATLIVEQAVDVFYTDRKGYVDSAVITDDGAALYVNDYKHGRGVSVQAEKNPQLGTYAMSLVNELGDLYGITDKTVCHLSIYQPRVVGEKAVRHWEITVKELKNHAEWIGAVAADILRDPFSQVFEPGDHQCGFCPAAPICPSRGADLLGTADPELPAKLEIKPPAHGEKVSLRDIATLTPEQLGRIIDIAGPLTKWLEKAKVHASALHQNGTLIPDHKMVASRPGNRRWKNKDEAEHLLRGLLHRSEFIEEKLISPAQAEEKLKARERPIRKSSWEKFNAAIERPEGSPILVPCSDERPELKDEQATDHFENEDDSSLL